MMRGSISSELLMRGRGVLSILLLLLMTRCCSDCVGVCGNGCCIAAVVENSGFLSLGVLKYVVCLCRGCDGCVSVSPCICCMFVFCVHHVAVLQAVFFMTCSALMLVEDKRGDHMKEAYSRASLITAL